VRWQEAAPHVVVPRLSTVPSQLSSMLLQTSAVGEPGVQVWGTPPTQLLTVRWQAPTPHVVVPRLLSTVPSQLSSMPLQTSAVGVPGVHVCGTPATQLLTVRWEGPAPPGGVAGVAAEGALRPASTLVARSPGGA